MHNRSMNCHAPRAFLKHMQESVHRNTKVAPPVNGMQHLTIAPDSLPRGPGNGGSDAAPLLTSSSPSPSAPPPSTPPPPSPRLPPKPPIPPNGVAASRSNHSSRNGTPSSSPRSSQLPRPPWIATVSSSGAYSQLVRFHQVPVHQVLLGMLGDPLLQWSSTDPSLTGCCKVTIY